MDKHEHQPSTIGMHDHGKGNVLEIMELMRLKKEKRIFEHDNNEKENSKGILAAHKMTTHVKKKTYAEAVKKQNSEILRTQNEIATLVVPDESRKYETSGKQEVTTHESAGESAGSCNA